MDTYSEILIGIGRIEGRIAGLERLSERVSALEQCQAWLKGGWAVLMAACAYLGKTIYQK
jgi:hypothetical protein